MVGGAAREQMTASVREDWSRVPAQAREEEETVTDAVN